MMKYLCPIALAVVALVTLTSLNEDHEVIRRKLTEVEGALTDDYDYFRQQNLRTVSFGTSRTWGAGMENPKDQAFTGLLNGTNMGIRASNSDYPAMCTHSMLGDEIYDVITIEYMPLEYKDLHDSLIELGTRLRNRFPDALIIFVNIWSNHQFRLRDRNMTGSMYALAGEVAASEGRRIAASYGQESSFLHKVADQHNEEEWTFLNTDEAWLRQAIQDPSIDGKVLHYDIPQQGQYINAMKSLSKLYLEDITHFSTYGHEWIAQQVMKIAHESKHKRSDRVNPWQTKDRCLNWLQTGTPGITTTMPVVPFSNGAKFALEASNPDLNMIELENDSDSDQHVYLSHMATGPDDIYGGATIEIREKPRASPRTSVQIDTRCTWSNFPVHVINHQHIDVIPKGKSYLVVKWDGMKEEKLPFRTTGLIMTPKALAGKTLEAHLD